MATLYALLLSNYKKVTELVCLEYWQNALSVAPLGQKYNVKVDTVIYLRRHLYWSMAV